MTRSPVIAIALVLAACSALAQGQTPVPAPALATDATVRGQIEAPGRVIVVRLGRLDPIPLSGGATLVISSVGAFEPGQEQQRVLGLRLDLSAPGLDETQGRHYMDVHEIESLLKALFLLEQVASEARAGFESEADYQTAEGFVIGVNVRDGKPRFWVEGGRGARARVGLPRVHVTTLRERFELARTRLFTE